MESYKHRFQLDSFPKLFFSKLIHEKIYKRIPEVLIFLMKNINVMQVKHSLIVFKFDECLELRKLPCLYVPNNVN